MVMDLMQGVSAFYMLHTGPVNPSLVHLELKLSQNAGKNIWYVGCILFKGTTDITIAHLRKQRKRVEAI